ncbi:MAG: hypothetical protein ACR2QC_07790 [Gammaproteobacteria bacterium]
MTCFPPSEAQDHLCCVDGCGERIPVDENSQFTKIGVATKRVCAGPRCAGWRWVYGDPADSKTIGGILLPSNLWPGFCGRAGPLTQDALSRAYKLGEKGE